MTKDIQIKAAGLSYGKVMFNPGIWQCEDIVDGVSLDMGGGAFIISFKDFTKMHEAAIAIRAANKVNPADQK